jgi:hypothetical protein
MDEQYIYVDSRHRDLTVNPNTNAYTMFMVTPIKHVTRVDLVSASIPVTSNLANNPYIFLDIEMFRSKYGIQSAQSNTSVKNTTPILQNYFAQIFYGSPQPTSLYVSNVQSGNTFYTSNVQTFKDYKEGEYKTSVQFKQPIESLDRLNIRWVDYNNVPVVFSPLNSNHSFMLRVYTTKMNIDNYEQLTLPPPVPKNFTAEDTHMYLVIIILVFGIGILLFSGSRRTLAAAG